MDDLKAKFAMIMALAAMSGDDKMVALTKIGILQNMIFEKVEDAPVGTLEKVVKLQEETLKILEGGNKNV